MQQTLTILSRSVVLAVLVCIIPCTLRAQEPVDSSSIAFPVLGPNDTIPVPAKIHGNEWIPAGYMEWFYVTAPYPKHLLKKRQEWTRLRNAIYVTYPYARKAGAIMNEMNAALAKMPEKKKKSFRSQGTEVRRQKTEVRSQSEKTQYGSQKTELYEKALQIHIDVKVSI